MVLPPTDAHPSLVPFEPAAERSLEVFGGTVSLVLVPQRRERAGRVHADRPAFATSPVARIVRDEAFWRHGDLALTPNRYPFAHAQRILWATGPVREPDAAFWRAALAWTAAAGGTALLNNVGAAATIARAHAHLVGERLGFLDGLPERPLASPPIDVPEGCVLCAKALPLCVVGVRGEPAAVANALVRLAEARLTAAWNVVLTPAAAWIAPRRVETPAPWFPQALGAAELWGRWCYVDEASFARATADDLERALVAALAPALS